jgi:hypothetical protein
LPEPGISTKSAFDVTMAFPETEFAGMADILAISPREPGRNCYCAVQPPSTGMVAPVTL